MNERRRLGVWRRLDPGDGEALKAFLIRHEDFAAGFSSRLLHGEELRIPGPVLGGVFGTDGEEGLRGAVLWHRSGLVFPVFDEPLTTEGAERLARFFRGGSLVSLMGDARHVQALASALGLEPRVSVAYRSMHLPATVELPVTPPPQIGARVLVRGPEDAEALFPLHSAYEREEVVTEIHRFDARLSRASLNRILESEIVAAADADGRLTAVARTNARGFRTSQIGGVYVIPELRGRGWGRYVVAYLAGLLRGEGRDPGLFVKEQNTPALALYRSMGFADVGPYRVDYL